MRDTGIGNSFREAGFTWIVSNSALASFHVPRFGMIFGAEVVLHLEFGKCEQTHVYGKMELAKRCDVINCVAIFYERGQSGSNFRHKEKFRAELPRDENSLKGVCTIVRYEMLTCLSNALLRASGSGPKVSSILIMRNLSNNCVVNEI